MIGESLMSGFVGAVIGGVITGGFTLYGIWRSEKFARSSSSANEAELVTALLQAIHDELEVVFDRYRAQAAPLVEALGDNEPFLVYFPIASDYFTVFNGNAHLIGRVRDHDLRRSIVRTYVVSKGLVDSFRMNNHMLMEYERAHELAAATQLPADLATRTAKLEGLVKYGSALKKDHYEATRERDELFRRFHKRGVLKE